MSGWRPGRTVRSFAIILLTALACDEDPVVPMGGGSIVLNVITAELARDPEGVGNFPPDVAAIPAEPFSHLDSARATVTAGATTRTITLTKGTGFTGRSAISRLAFMPSASSGLGAARWTMTVRV